jgi:uncharacterized protein (TIGR02466 family)
MLTITELIPFKDAVWIGELDGVDFEKLLALADEIKQDQPVGVSVSNRGGWQSDSFWQHDIDKYQNSDAFQNLIKVLSGLIQEGVNYSYKPHGLFEIEPGNSWFNFNLKNDYNILHNHPESVFSSVVYLTDDNSPLVLSDVGSSRNTSVAITKTANIFQTQFKYTPKKGDYIIFPSWFLHYVEQNDKDNLRVSLATNFKIHTEN